MRNLIIAALSIGTLAFGATACTPAESDTKTHAEKVMEAQSPKAGKTKDKAEKPVEQAPKYTVSQENAIASATDYLAYTAFSKSGLADQLMFEDYSKADAEFAVNHIDVDWNQQAAASAKDYLDYSSFSKQGLIEQLVFEGYTQEQAAFGVSKTGL